MQRKTTWALVLACAGVAAFVCRTHGPETNPSVSHTFDFQALRRATHFAFRTAPEGTITADLDAFSASVNEQGFATFSSPGASMQLRCDSIRRGDNESVFATPSPAQLDAQGRVHFVSGDIDETLANDERGTEQTFTFAQAPVGVGAVEVRVTVAGATYLDTTEGGLHFRNANGTAGFRYGHGTWVDARGTRTEIPARWVGESIHLTVPSTLIDESTYPAVLDPLVSAEIELDTPISNNAIGAQVNPTVAFDGTNYVVVFQDVRIGFGGFDLFGARVSPQGALIDPTGFVLSANTSSAEQKAIISCSLLQRCLVSFTDVTGTSVPVTTGRYLILDTTTASVVPGSSGTIFTKGKNQVITSSAFDGTDFVALWSEAGSTLNENDVRAARIAPSTGLLRDPTGFAIAVTTDSEGPGYIDCASATCFVGWQASNGAGSAGKASRLSMAGTPTLLDVPALTVAPSTSGVRGVAIHNGVGLAVWFDFVNGMVDAVRINMSTGAPIDVSPLWVSQLPAMTNLANVSVTGGPSGFVVSELIAPTTMVSNATYARLTVVSDTTGNVTPDGGAQVPTATFIGPFTTADVASDGTSYLFVWPTADGQTSGEIDAVLATPTSTDFTFGAPIHLTQTANDERQAKVSADPSGFLVAWVDHRRGQQLDAGVYGTLVSDVYAARVSADGIALDPAGKLLSSQSWSASFGVDVAFDGTRYLVVWNEAQLTMNGGLLSGAIKGARIDPATGTVIDAPARTLANANFGTPSICGAAGQFFVAWSTGPIVGMRVVGATGAVLDATPILITPTSTQNGSPDVSCTADAGLVVWENDKPYFGVPTADIYAKRFDLFSGAIYDANDAGGLGVAIQQPLIERAPSVTTLGNMHYVAWEDTRSGISHIYVSRIDALTGAVLDDGGVRVSSADGGQSEASVTNDGVTAFVAFRDDTATPDVLGARVDVNGAVLDTTPLAIAASNTIEGEPSTASTPTGTIMVAYSRFVPESPYGAVRVRARTTAYARPNGASCRANADCAGSICEDSVCCATACGGSATNDCMACSTAAGAAVNGACGVVTNTAIVCRAARSACDVAESCTGASTACPADALMNDGMACDDGLACTPTSSCAAGVCTGVATSSCDAGVSGGDGGTGSPDGGSDGGASSTDGGLLLPDGGTTSDAGTVQSDGGSTTNDGGSMSPDGGNRADGGADAGLPDAGVVVPNDAGMMSADGGVVTVQPSGCGCNGGAADSFMLSVVGLALLGARSIRRRRS